MSQSYLYKVQKIIHKIKNHPVDEIKEESSLKEDLNMDVFDLSELSMFLEDEFELDISDQDSSQFKKIKDIIQYIENSKKTNA